MPPRPQPWACLTSTGRGSRGAGLAGADGSGSDTVRGRKLIGVTSPLEAARRLHRYLVDRHWRSGGLRGPDPGIRLNARIGRFVKSYARFLPWGDDLSYMQAQGYWILDNWRLFDVDDDASARSLAIDCSDFVLSQQRPEGYWPYPNPEWAGRIATVEGCWASLGLLESYDRTGREAYLDGARRWTRFLLDDVGFLQPDGLLAIRYFAPAAGSVDRQAVPNNTTLLLWVLARLAQLTGESAYLEHAPPMLEWLARAQRPSGELPYATPYNGGAGRPHFLCFQYNAFEFVDLVHYLELTHDARVIPILERLAEYLATGLTPSGAGRYDCSHDRPEVGYYTSAVARAVSLARRTGLLPGDADGSQAFERVLAQQRPDGSFGFYSRANYGVLSDRRSYPRYLAMTLNHLLEEHLIRRHTPEPARVAETV